MGKKSGVNDIHPAAKIAEKPPLTGEESLDSKDNATIASVFGTKAETPKKAPKAVPQAENLPPMSMGVQMLGRILKSALAVDAQDLTSAFEGCYFYDKEENDHIFSLVLRKHIPGQGKWSKETRSAMRIEARDRLDAFLNEIDVLADPDKIFIDFKYGDIYTKTKYDLYNLLDRYLIEKGYSHLEIGKWALVAPEPMEGYENIPANDDQHFAEHRRVKAQLNDKLLDRDPTIAENFLTCAFNIPFNSIEQYKAHTMVAAEQIGPNVMKFSTMMDMAREQIMLEEKMDRRWDDDYTPDYTRLRPSIN